MDNRNSSTDREVAITSKPCQSRLNEARRLLRYVWAAPTTLLGMPFVLAALVGGGEVRVVNGVVEVCGGACALFLRRCTLLRGGASAMTLGHIVLGRDRQCLERTRAHERVHVRQVERWGPLFIPAYLTASLVAMACGRNPYRDNRFEREAYDSDASISRSCKSSENGG